MPNDKAQAELPITHGIHVKRQRDSATGEDLWFLDVILLNQPPVRYRTTRPALRSLQDRIAQEFRKSMRL